MRIDINATYKQNGGCCHYRQLVSGHFEINGVPQQDISGSGLPVTDGTYVQDGADSSSDSNAYSDYDTPGFNGVGPNDDVDAVWEFLFEIIDSCRNNMVVALKSGSVYVEGTYKRDITHYGFDD